MNINFRNRRRGPTNGSRTPSNGADTAQGDISYSEYAQRRKELMKLIGELRDLVGGMKLDLPWVAVIGNQSSGKSSVVEAVSGINVPRNSGTCTRCPMECSMHSSASSWSCDISLRISHDSNNHSMGSGSERIHFGAGITDRSSVELWLRRAQAAILNPHLPPETFVGKTLQEVSTSDDSRTLKFSKNTVCVDIQDPDATDLSFVDLPGLIQNAEEDVINVVRSLAEHYTQIPGTIILVVIPMSDDMENQKAVRLAADADPEGERTIGVLTKPDTLSDGEISSRRGWINVLEGREHKTKHGYYCVRLPNEAERSRNLTRSDVNANAARFFAQPPWNEVADRGRFGVPCFVSDISKLLMQHIEAALPKLKRQVSERLAKCIDEISKLPPTLENDPAVEITLMVAKFTDDLHHAIYGGSNTDKSLIQQNRAVYEMYDRDIFGTAPNFQPLGASEVCLHDVETQADIMGVHDVREVIQSEIAWEFPGDVPSDAKTTLIRKFTNIWGDHSRTCFDRVHGNLVEFVNALIERHFGRFRKLKVHIRSVFLEKISDCKNEAAQDLQKILRLESTPYFTLNRQSMDFERDAWRRRYQDIRFRSHYSQAEQKALVELANAGYGTLTHEDLTHLLTYEFKAEVDLMADVRAYFQVAYKRIADNVPLTIEHALNQNLTDNLRSTLFHDLLSEGSASKRMQEFLSEDPAIAATRERLAAEHRRLVDIQCKLNEFSIDT